MRRDDAAWRARRRQRSPRPRCGSRSSGSRGTSRQAGRRRRAAAGSCRPGWSTAAGDRSRAPPDRSGRTGAGSARRRRCWTRSCPQSPPSRRRRSPTSSRWWISSHWRIGFSCSRNGPSFPSTGVVPLSVCASAGSPVFETEIERPEMREQLLEVRRERRTSAERRREVARDRPQIAHERISVARERLAAGRASPWTRRGTSGKILIACASFACWEAVAENVLSEFVIRLRRALLVLGERAEDDAGVRHEPPHRAALGGEHVEQVGAVGGERGRLPSDVREVLPALPDRAARGPAARCGTPAASRVERVEDLVELDAARHPGLRAADRPRARWARPASRACIST